MSKNGYALLGNSFSSPMKNAARNVVFCSRTLSSQLSLLPSLLVKIAYSLCTPLLSLSSATEEWVSYCWNVDTTTNILISILKFAFYNSCFLEGTKGGGKERWSFMVILAKKEERKMPLSNQRFSRFFGVLFEIYLTFMEFAST